MSDKSTAPDHFVAYNLLENDSVFRILIDRPKGNILTIEMIRQLLRLLDEAEGISRLRLVILRGGGGHFSYGTSIDEHRESAAPELLASFHKLVRRLAAFPVPVAALVEGTCFGGGFEIVLCCHFVFATPNAQFACPEIKLGVLPPVLAAAGGLRLGNPLTERLLLTGATVNVAEAKQAGLITEVLPGIGDPEEALTGWYRQHLRPLSAFSLRLAAPAGRAALIEALGEPLARIERLYLDSLLTSHDGREGIEAFLARREPHWESS